MTKSGEYIRKPRVLILSFSPIIRDPRVYRQIERMSKFSDVVTCGYGEAPKGVIEHIQIPDSYRSWRKNVKIAGLLLFARAHHRLYFRSERIKFVQAALPVGSVDVIIANDVLAAPVALSLEAKYGVHADLHEYAPRQAEDRLLWRLLVKPLMEWAVRGYVTKTSSSSTVAKGIAEEYARVYGMEEPAVVPNASSYDDRYGPTDVHSPVRMVHTGAAGRVRRIEAMIEAVAKANEMHEGFATLDLVMVPGDQKYIDELSALAAKVPGKAVRMKSPVPFDQIVTMLQGYDIGFYLCPPSNFNMEHALPNKLFEFIQARLAVVVGPSPEMARVVRDYGVGAVSENFDPETVARLLVSLTPEMIASMKSASHEAAYKLSAEALTGPWEDAVRELISDVDHVRAD